MESVELSELRDQLIILAERLGYQVRYERLTEFEELKVQAGSCRLSQQKLIFIDPASHLLDQIQTLKAVIQHEDLDNIFLTPKLRETLKSSQVF